MIQHDIGCWYARPRDETGRELGHSDAAKRLSDQYMLHRMANPYAIGRWFACRLNDGTSDGTLYDTRSECIRHQKHYATWYVYTKISPADMSVCDAESWMRSSRLACEATGNLMSDPDREIISPLTREDNLQRMVSMARRGSMPLPTGKRG